MQASLKWLNDYVNITEKPEVLAEKLTMAGIPVERIAYLGEGIEKVVTGKVVEIKHHPDADKLWICRIDVGQEVLTIVTGAQNVHMGNVVPVALVGAKLPTGLKIKPAKLRGIDSAGMLCSTTELNLDSKTLSSDAKDGIYILPEDTAVGLDIQSVLGLDDVVLEFELTANRADCFSMVGIAREISVLTDETLKKPILNLKELAQQKATGLVKITVDESALCSRFCVRVLQNVKVGPSPLWMQQHLRNAGMRPINNIVDVTNFVMLELGQPMHAYDYSLISKHHLIVRKAYAGEPLTTLDGIKRTLNESMLVIADEGQAIGIAGVMGGLATEVTNNTQTVVLEAAAFNGVSIRRTSRALGLRSEASGRFERGVDVANIIRALDRAAKLLTDMGACSVCPGIIDSYSQVALPKQIAFSPVQINRRLGTDVSASVMIEILRKLECTVEKQDDHYLVTVPSWRGDMTGIADLSEEIARIHGFHNITSTTPQGAMVRGTQSEKQILEDKVRQILVGMGFDETISYSFMHPQTFDKLNLSLEDPVRRAINILNPITDEFPLLRTTLIGVLLDTVVRNLSRKNDDMKIFELGAIYLPKDLPLRDFPQENLMLCGAFVGRRVEIAWNQPGGEVDFYDAKGAIEELLAKLGIRKYSIETGESNYLHPGKTATIRQGDKVLGVVGELHPKVLANFGLTKKVVVFELNMNIILQGIEGLPVYKALPKYPSTSRDLAVVLPLAISCKDVSDAIIKSAGSLLADLKLFDVYSGGQVPEGSRSLAFSLTFRSIEKTLTDEEVDSQIENTVAYLEKTFGAVLRS